MLFKTELSLINLKLIRTWIMTQVCSEFAVLLIKYHIYFFSTAAFFNLLKICLLNYSSKGLLVFGFTITLLFYEQKKKIGIKFNVWTHILRVEELFNRYHVIDSILEISFLEKIFKTPVGRKLEWQKLGTPKTATMDSFE